MEFGIVADLTDSTVAVTDLAVAIEDAGLESLFLTHRTHLPADRSDLMSDPAHVMDARLLDPFVALGAAAAVTSRLKLGTGICQVPLLDPIVLAKQVATLDVLSGGRFIFGIGAGWLHGEIRNHGIDPAQRWDVLRERVLAMKAIWTNDVAEYHGRFVDFSPLRLEPKPVQKPHPPILVGVNGARGLALTMEYGDGWAPIVSDAAEIEASMAELRRLCLKAGRTPVPVTAVLWEVDEPLIERCVELGVSRSLIYLYPERRTDLAPFLDRWTRLAARC